MEDHDEHDHDHASLMLEDEEIDIEPTRVVGVEEERDEFWDHDPNKEELWEMKKANKRPSEWLKLICREWAEAEENLGLIETVDGEFESYKPYLRGKLSSQLLCRLCIPSGADAERRKQQQGMGNSNNYNKADFLKNVLHIEDDFDRAYIIAQVERFCTFYDIRGVRRQQQQQDEAKCDTIAAAFENSTTNNSNGITSNSNSNANTSSNHVNNNNSNNNRSFAVSNNNNNNNEAAAAAAAALYGDLVVNVNAASLTDVHQQAIAAAAAASAAAAGNHHQSMNMNMNMNGMNMNLNLPHQFLTADATAAAVAAAQQAAQQQSVADQHEHHKASASSKHSHSHVGNGSDCSSAGSSTNYQQQQQPQQQNHNHNHQGVTIYGANNNNNNNNHTHNNQHLNKTAAALLTKAQQQAKSAERALEQERRQNAKREQRRLSQDKKLARQRDRECLQKQKQAEKLAREKAREEKRTHKLMQRQERERFAQEQKEAALLRAAELVASNRVPIEITRAGVRGRGRKPSTAVSGLGLRKNSLKSPQQPGNGGVGVGVRSTPTTNNILLGSTTAAGAAGSSTINNNTVNHNGTAAATGTNHPKYTIDLLGSVGIGPKKRQRSAIVVSTASDLDRIVTHSQNLWAKYNAIAKEHNQRVNWITVAKELGIHVKVREKYARMHSRACQRNFDFVASGHLKIKDHPEIFQEPTAAEQKARMPPPLPPPVDIDVDGNTNMTLNEQQQAAAAHRTAIAEAVAIVDEQHGKEMVGLVTINGNVNTTKNTMVGLLANCQNENVAASNNENNYVDTRNIIEDGTPTGTIGQGREGKGSGGRKEKQVVAVGGNSMNDTIARNGNGPSPTAVVPVVVPVVAAPPIPPPHDPVDAAAAAATAAAVVDAAGVGGAAIDMHHVAAVAAATAEGTGSPTVAPTSVMVGVGENVYNI